MFSCGHKSGIETHVATDTSKITNETESKNERITAWRIDAPDSKIKFTIKNMGMTVDGTLDGLKGQLFFDENNLNNSKFEVAVEINTISTGIAKHDKDLMANKYFNTEKFSQITFRSDSIIKNGKDFIVIGDFTIKGLSQHRKIPFSFEQKENHGIFKSDFVINRMDFNVGSSNPIMGTDVNVAVELWTNRE